MAYTYPIKHLRVREMTHGFLTTYVRYAEETASQTFVQGAPLVYSSGLLTEGSDPAGATNGILGFANRPGQNLATPLRLAEFIPATDGVEFWANFLAAAGASTTGATAIAVADIDTGLPLAKASVLPPDSTAMWYIEDTSSTDSVKIVSTLSDHVQPASGDRPGADRVAMGDANARVLCVVLDAARAWN
jgi:hypothetical protein